MSLHDVPPMAASSSVQRPLAEGAQGTLGVPPRVEAAAAEPEPEDDPHAFDAGVAVTSLAELEALLERGGPLADEEPAGVDEEQLRAMLDLKPVLVDGLFDPAANDYVAEPANSISIDLSRAPVVSPDAFAASVARGCGDRLLTLARDRWHHPLKYRARDEARMLAQVDALICIGDMSPLLRWYEHVSSPEACWASVFALACMDGREPLEAIAALPLDSFEHAVHAADAVAASFNAHVLPLARALIDSDSALSRVFAIELLSKREAISMADLVGWLSVDDPLVQRAALRAMARSAEIAPVDRIQPLIGSDDADVAWCAAHACTLLGSATAYDELRTDPALAHRLGARVVEIYVMTGEPRDMPALQRIVNSEPMTPQLLDALARFGEPTVWQLLSHYLGDPQLCDAASSALETLFGACVEPDAAGDHLAWRDAIGALRLSPEVRLRCGKPWSPPLVAEQWRDGALSAVQIQLRLDELRTRGGVAAQVPLHGWGAAPQQALAVVEKEANEAARTHRAGSWHWR